MDDKFTPGPWAARETEDGYYADMNIVRSDGLAVGVAVMNGNITREETAANARLIAAAPELLAALRLCIPTNVCLTNPNIRDDLIVPLDVQMGDLRKIAAAIAKAQGTPPGED
jgi:hypothetical protein